MRYRTLFTFAAMVLLGLLLGEAYGGYVTQGLFAYWSFDQDTIAGQKVKDLAGNNDATMEGNPKIIPGIHKEAIEFDGQGSYADLTILKGFGPKLRAFSIDFWIQTEVTPDWTTLFKTLSSENSMGWSIDLNRSGGAGFAYREGATFPFVRDSAGKFLSLEILTDIFDGEWHHVAWVVSDVGKNTSEMYVDGNAQEVIFGTQNSPEDLVDFQHPVYLGAANNRGNIERFCPAAVDEFRIYTRALKAAEVRQNLQSGAAVDCLDKLPVLWGELKADI